MKCEENVVRNILVAIGLGALALTSIELAPAQAGNFCPIQQAEQMQVHHHRHATQRCGQTETRTVVRRTVRTYERPANPCGVSPCARPCGGCGGSREEAHLVPGHATDLGGLACRMNYPDGTSRDGIKVAGGCIVAH